MVTRRKLAGDCGSMRVQSPLCWCLLLEWCPFVHAASCRWHSKRSLATTSRPHRPSSHSLGQSGCSVVVVVAVQCELLLWYQRISLQMNLYFSGCLWKHVPSGMLLLRWKCYWQWSRLKVPSMLVEGGQTVLCLCLTDAWAEGALSCSA